MVLLPLQKSNRRENEVFSEDTFVQSAKNNEV
jgi:hypothetical protein